jgi:hypothetical protein
VHRRARGPVRGGKGVYEPDGGGSQGARGDMNIEGRGIWVRVRRLFKSSYACVWLCIRQVTHVHESVHLHVQHMLEALTQRRRWTRHDRGEEQQGMGRAERAEEASREE